MGIRNKERVKAIFDLTGIINPHGAILNFLRFSDISPGISIETEFCKVNNLYAWLRGLIIMDETEICPSKETADRLVLLNVAFSKGTRDLEIGNHSLIE